MPIDPNIAMGVRPIEQPNMLGQMGQFMQLRQMQQENDTQNALRDWASKGGDMSNPESIRQLRMINPKLAQELIYKEQQSKNLTSEISSRDLKTGADSLKLLKENVGVVSSPQDMATFLQNAANTPGGKLLFSVVPLDKALSSIPNDPKAFEAYKRNFGLTSDKLYESADAQLKSRTDYGTTAMNNRQSDINSQRTDTREREKRDLVATENGYVLKDLYGNLDQVKGYGTLNGPNAPAKALPPAAASTFVTPQANTLAPAAANTNALTAPPVNQPGAPTVANAKAMNVPRPAPRAGYKYNEQGQQVKVEDQNLTEAQGKATGFALRAAEAHKVLDTVGKSGEVQPGLIKRVAEGVPLVGESLGTALNATQSSQQQQVEQAQRAFVNAILRQESGAAISESEFANAKKQYFPQPGDKPAVIEQKRQNRETAIKSLEIAGGPGMKQANADPTGLKAGTVEDGYRFKGGDPANKSNWEKQ